LSCLREGGGECFFESQCSLLIEWKIFLYWERLRFHQGFNHFDGSLVEVFFRRGDVISPSEVKLFVKVWCEGGELNVFKLIEVSHSVAFDSVRAGFGGVAWSGAQSSTYCNVV
jgi:hypothetical protein